VAVLADPEQHQVERLHAPDCRVIERRRLLGAELARDPEDGAGVDAGEQRLLGHPVVALRVVRRDAALVAEEQAHPSPLHRQPGEDAVHKERRGAARQDQRARAILDGGGDRLGGGPGDLPGVGEDPQVRADLRISAPSWSARG